jgi:hypothetical protein
MDLKHLLPEQISRRAQFRAFVDEEIAPHAARIDSEQALPAEVIARLAKQGYLGAVLSESHGGLGMDMVDYGLLAEELGRTCQSVRNFVAVEDMVALSIARWGTASQRERWLPRIVAGQTTAAFALTEPDVGSDAATVRTTATADGDHVVLNGTKKWISFAQIADLFLVFGQFEGGHIGFLVERNTPGLSVEPIRDLLGLRGSMLGEITLRECRVPLTEMVGRPGYGLTFVASSALDLGRYSTAWGSVGLAEACLNRSVAYSRDRIQYGKPISEHQLVQRMLADMLTDTMTARLLCHHAGVSRSRRDVDAVHLTLMAKYRASTVAMSAASDAVQLHGAAGIGSASAVERHYRDAKVMEIIEGTTQIQQGLLGQFAVQAAGR